VGYGDNVIDSFIDRRIDYAGGNSINVAVFSAQRGAEAAYMGVFGSDAHGAYIQDVLDRLGIDHSHSVVREGETGIARVEVIRGERVFRGGNGGGITVREPLVLGVDEMEYLASFDVVHSSVYSSTETQLSKLDALGRIVIYDLSVEEAFRTPAYLRQVAPHADLALLSCSDVSSTQTRAILRRVVSHGARMALATRGTDGSVIFDGVGFHAVAATALPGGSAVRDTMGCGDAFLAAFVTRLFDEGWRRGNRPAPAGIRAALATASAFAAEQCLVEGAFGNGRVWSAGETAPADLTTAG
jgi:sugar/nucleoside kinase (ribokinase family)